jgi:beta-N-acetylhexosaminidase
MDNMLRDIGLSRRKLLARAGQAAASLFLAGCASPTALATLRQLSEFSLIRPPLVKPPMPTLIQPKLNAPHAPLEVKIGQMIMVGFRGLTAPEASLIIRNIREQHIGGVVLFDYDVALNSPVRNIQSPAQVKNLIAELQGAASTPLLVAVDQEGGIVNRFKENHGFPPSVSAQYLGARDDLDMTRQYAGRMAQTLAEVGVNLNLAPVVDLNKNPQNPVIGRVERSFSAEPAAVADHATAFIEAHHQHHVGCTLKHFPGHGSSRDDTHLGFVDVTHTWGEDELEPYAHLMQRGLADAVMTAHIFNADLDPDLPATLSQKIITGILREQLGYDGVVISDDLQMKAISDFYTFEKAVQLAVQAGVDIIAMANNTAYTVNVAAHVAATIRQMVENGTIGEARIDQSYQRIMRLKERIISGDLRI